jgi:hypothetical protein
MAIRPDTDELIAYLNNLLQVDPSLIHQLVITRFACNTKMTEHPTVQVYPMEGEWAVGLLGILNGYCGVYDDGPRQGYGPISVLMSTEGGVVGFTRTPNE